VGGFPQAAGEGAEAVRWRQGRPPALRPGDDVQDHGSAGALYGLSDDQAEFQIQDRLSFMRFLGLGLGDRVPDAKTIWLFREHLTQAKAVENLFARFDKHLTRAGYLAMGGQIVDATIVAAPKQRNTDAEKTDIKAGEVPDAWKDKPAKLRQKDRDARWTVKFSKAKVAEDGKTQQRDIAVPAFGYKNHASIDRRHGFIRLENR
jgi:IS5 family transposase